VLPEYCGGDTVSLIHAIGLAMESISPGGHGCQGTLL
jgi:hypothetical protein